MTMMVPGGGGAVQAALGLPAAWGGGGAGRGSGGDGVPALMNGGTGGSPLAALFGGGGARGASPITGGMLSGQDPTNPYVMHAFGGPGGSGGGILGALFGGGGASPAAGGSGGSGGGGGIGGFAGMLKNFKGIKLGGFTRSAVTQNYDPDTGDPDGTSGGGINGVGGLAGAGLMAGGMFLAQRGLLGSSRGTWGGVAQGAIGGAMVGMAVGGPIGAAIGAGVGAGIGIGEKIAGVESPENEAKRLVKQLYSISIDNATASNIADIAKQKYAGHVSIAVRDPDVRKMLMLYSQATGQKMPLSASTPQSASLAETGGKLYQQASYVNGMPYAFQSSLPVLGGYQTGTYPTPGGNPMSLQLNVSGQGAAQFVAGQVVTPEFVQAQWSNAGASSNGRLQNSAMMQQPGLLV